MIITLTQCNFNMHLAVLELAFMVMLRSALPECRFTRREYRIEFKNKRFTLQTALVTLPSGTSFCIWPAMKLPRRPYPAAAYLYAVAMYLSSNLSQRQVSEQVKRLFQLQNFSHSTISRSVAKLLSRLDDLEAVFGTGICSPSAARRARWTTAFYAAAQRLTALLGSLLRLPTLDAVMNAGNQLAYQFFHQTGGQFIL